MIDQDACTAETWSSIRNSGDICNDVMSHDKDNNDNNTEKTAINKKHPRILGNRSSSIPKNRLTLQTPGPRCTIHVKKFLMDIPLHVTEHSAHNTENDLHENVDRVSVEHLNYNWIGNSSISIDWVLEEILNFTPKSSISDENFLNDKSSSTPINQAWVDECFNCIRLSPILKQINDEAELAAIAAKFLSDSREEFSCMNITETTDELIPRTKSKFVRTSKKLAANINVTRNEDVDINDEISSELPIYCEKCARIIPDDVLKCSGCRNCYHRACCTESKVINQRWPKKMIRPCPIVGDAKGTHVSSSTTPRVLMGSTDIEPSKIKSKKLDRISNSENIQSKITSEEEDRNIEEHRTSSDICLFCRINKADFSKSAYCNTKCLKKTINKLHEHFNYDLDARVAVIDCETRKIMAGSSAPKLKNIPTYLETHRRYFPRVFSALKEEPTEKPTKKKKKVEKQKPKSIDQKKKTDQIQSQTSNASYKVDHVRILVRQHLRDCLFDRLKHCDDILLSKDELNPIAIDIEKAMFVANKEEVHSPSYKQQFKALLVNLKEQHNQGFFRRILNGTLSPHKVATMSGQEMASRENSQWSTLGAKSCALECTDNASTSKVGNLSTVDTPEKSMENTKSLVESRKTTADDVIAATFAEIPNNFDATEKSSKTYTKRRIEDTTMGHKSHLFDLNCKVCAGKMTKKQYQELISTAKRPKMSVVENSTNNPKVNEVPLERSSDYYQNHSRSVDYEESVERRCFSNSMQTAQPSTPENAPFIRSSSSNDNFRQASSSSSSRPVLLSPPVTDSLVLKHHNVWTLIFAPVDDSDINFTHPAILNVDSFVEPSPPSIIRRPTITSPMRNISPFSAGGQRLLPPVARIPPIQSNLPTMPVPETSKNGSEWRQMTPSSSSSSPATQIGIIRMPPVFDSAMFVQGAETGMMSLPPPPMPPPVPDYLKDGHCIRTSNPIDPRLSPRKHLTSTVETSVEPSPPLFDEYVWRGVLDMPGYYRFNSAFVGVSGSFEFLSRELPNHLRIVGRITKETVYDYVENLKGDNTKRMTLSPQMRQDFFVHCVVCTVLKLGQKVCAL
uniref:TFIIS central domain-containing protein n=1 Tax=Romanomermis culicivorax TaxID=13658 RepID=A0A915JJD0_ROMCU